jgi:glycosyltransferase involved in cell wall biosynthesis
MLCNVVPVASNTGFCPDLIKHGENGFLFDSTDPAEKVIDLINKAYQLKNSVREAALPHSWENYGKKIFSLFQEIKK